MSHYSDFIAEVELSSRLFQEIGHKVYPLHELQHHAAEYAVFKTVANLMKQATIIRLRGEQSAIFLNTPFDGQQDFIQWLRLPYETIYIQPDTPFRFTGYLPKTEDELQVWYRQHAAALTQEERVRLEQLRVIGEPEITGILLFDATKFLHRPGSTSTQDGMMIDILESADLEMRARQIERLFHVVFLIPLPGFTMNVHSFTIGVLKDNTIWCAKRSSTENVLAKAQQWVIHLINFLSSPSVKLVPNQPDAALQKARARRGKPPLPGWYEISLRQVIKDYTKDKMSTQGWHHSFRYDVRGFFRHYKQGRLAGRVCWVSAHQRGLANQLYKPKGYRQEGLSANRAPRA